MESGNRPTPEFRHEEAQIAIALNLSSRRVIGRARSDRLKRDLAIEAPRRALVARNPAPGPVHHSGRGSHYCSVDYRAELRQRRLLISDSASARECLPAVPLGDCLQSPAVGG